MIASRQIEATELSRMLADDIERVVDGLAIDVAHRSRRTLYAYAPWSADRKAKLEIDVGLKPGRWNDWLGGKWGDAFDLVAVTLGHGERDRRAAYRWALAHFDLSDRPDAAEREAWLQRKLQAEARAKDRARKTARELSEARRTAQAQWLAAHPIAAGDDADAYLQARGIDLRRLARTPRAVRWSPAQHWFNDDGEIEHTGPAIMSAMTLADGKFGSLHRIWIDPGRPGQKADIEPPRKMWPSSDGCAIRLWRGESGLSEADAAKRGGHETVVVCEGVEDGLSIALMTPELRVIAAGSLPGLLSLSPPKCARRLVIAADNDWDKPQAQALLTRACERLAGECGLAVSIARSPEGKDFNDLLRGA